MKNVLFFFAGIVSFCFLTEIPQFLSYYWLIISCLLWIAFPRVRWISSFIVGFLWLGLSAQEVATHQLPQNLIGQTLSVTGVVDSLPEVMDKKTRFLLRVNKMSLEGQEISAPEKIRLSWYGHPASLVAGETWQLDVRLKPPRGLANPGGFDYERWLFENRINAVGYVVDKGIARRLSPAPWYSVNAWRQSLRESLLQHSNSSKQISLITALLIGDRSQVTEHQWDVLTATGTNHLLAISGLHIGLVAGFSFWLFQYFFKKTGRLLLYFPAYKMAAVVALLNALIYAAFAGFSIPTQRALVMLAAALIFLLINRRLSAPRIVAIALLAVLLFDPLSILSVSFWLSFAAVVIIIYSMRGRVLSQGLWWKWGRLQWAISLAMIPVILFAFETFSVVSPIANIVAVPWVSFVVVPLIFIAAIFNSISPLFEALLQLSDYALSVIWWILERLAALPLAQWHGHINGLPVLFIALIGVTLILAPRGLPFRLPGYIMLLPVFLFAQHKIPEGEFRLTLLDVGQGLGAVVETREHTLVYDTGAKFGDSFDMGDSVIAPYLQTRKTNQIDTLVISHGDNDHIGGMESLLKKFTVNLLLSGVMDKTPYRMAMPCSSQQSWQWDSVSFEVLHPPFGSDIEGNNGSCVIKISNTEHSVLLTGDIEKAAERTLIQKIPTALDVDVLVAPHHGSKTSSTTEFIKAVSPDWVLFPAGYANRFGFPRPEIVQRYQEQKINNLVSGENGAISFEFSAGKPLKYSVYRISNKKFWLQSPVRLLPN